MFNLIASMFRQPKESKRRRRNSSPALPCEVLEERLPLTLFTTETHVNTTTADNQFQSETASNASGQTVIVWTSRFSSTDTDIKAQRFDASGNKVGSQISVASTSRAESDPAVSMDSFGDFVIVWVDPVSSTDKDLKAQRYSSSGSTRGGVISIATETKNEYAPSIASASNGDFVVSYTLDFSSTDQDIKAKRFSDAGVLQSTISVSTSSADDEVASSVARAPDGRFSIAYQVNVGGGSNSDVILKRFGATGSLITTHSIATGTNDQERPSVSMDDAANSVVAWQELILGDNDIKARVVSNAGVMQNAATIASSTDNEFDADVAFRRSGGIYVVTYTRGAKTAPSTSWQVRGAEVTSSTGLIRNAFSAATSTAGSSIAFGNGDFYSFSYETRVSRIDDVAFGIFRRRGQV